MFIRQLTNPTEQDIEQGTEVWFQSLRSNSHMAFNAEWNDSTLKLICKARLEVGCKDHCIWVAGRTEGIIEGLIYVNPPGTSWGESRSTPEGPHRYYERMSVSHADWLENTVSPWFLEACSRAFSEVNLRDSLYINLLGVRPSAQGKGVGSALMDLMVNMADKDGATMTLETQGQKTTDWYARWGFETRLIENLLVRDEEIPSWFLVRPVNTASQGVQADGHA